MATAVHPRAPQGSPDARGAQASAPARRMSSTFRRRRRRKVVAANETERERGQSLDALKAAESRKSAPRHGKVAEKGTPNCMGKASRGAA